MELNRRRMIAGFGLAAGSAAVAPLLYASDAAAEGANPDALLKAGRFDEAARGYEKILRTDPNNAHAARHRGYVALLSNRFADTEKYLTLAVRLPYQVSVGPSGRVPWLSMDPLPAFEASVNGLPPKKFLWDSHSIRGLALSTQMAEEAGLREVSRSKVSGGGSATWT